MVDHRQQIKIPTCDFEKFKTLLFNFADIHRQTTPQSASSNFNQ